MMKKRTQLPDRAGLDLNFSPAQTVERDKRKADSNRPGGAVIRIKKRIVENDIV